jgi:hypothetical protein
MQRVTRLLRIWLIFTRRILVLDLWPQNPSCQDLTTLSTKNGKEFRSRMKVWEGGREGNWGTFRAPGRATVSEGEGGDCCRQSCMEICNHARLTRVRSGRRRNWLGVSLERIFLSFDQNRINVPLALLSLLGEPSLVKLSGLKEAHWFC